MQRAKAKAGVTVSLEQGLLQAETGFIYLRRPICEGLSVVEQRKWEALIPALGGVKHSFVTHDSPFEAASSGQGLSKR